MSSRTSLQSTRPSPSPHPADASAIPSLASLADPPTRQIDACAMDYFLIEMVTALRASSLVATARAKKLEKDMVESGLIPSSLVVPAVSNKKESATTSTPRDSMTSLNSKPSGAKDVADEDEEAVRIRLESIGMHVGANFTERLALSRPLNTETLDSIKFICKDIWIACWDKQVDNLRTNHRGVYVLQDNTFKPIARVSSWEGKAEGVKKAKLYAAMPAGIIRGALSRMGYIATVAPEITSLPQCTFQIKLPKNT